MVDISVLCKWGASSQMSIYIFN